MKFGTKIPKANGKCNLRKLREHYGHISAEWWLCAVLCLSVTGSYGTSFYPHSYVSSHLDHVYMSYKHVLPIHQPDLDAESGDWRHNDLFFTKYPQSKAQIQIGYPFQMLKTESDLMGVFSFYCMMFSLVCKEKKHLAWSTLIIRTEHTSGLFLPKPL